MKVLMLSGLIAAIALLPVASPSWGASDAKKVAPGQMQKNPGDAKKFAPGQRQKKPGQAKTFAPGQRN